MRQTSTYASVRSGRVSVFWGDQVFVPSAGIKATTHAADIMAALRPMPTKEEWEAPLVEYEAHTGMRLGPCHTLPSVGPSLGGAVTGPSLGSG